MPSDSESSVYSDLENEEDESSSEASLSYEEEKNETDSEIGSESTDVNKKSSKEKVISSSQEKPSVDEYEVDSSDEEDLRNTVGDIPLNWYDDYPHIGYDKDGTKILKPAYGDELDEYLKKIEDPNYWRTVRDKMTGQDVLLTDEDVDIIQQIQKGRYPDSQFDPYAPFEDFFTYKKMIHPVTNRPEDKRSFIPSLVEKEKVARMVYAIKMGWIKPKQPRDNTPKFFMLWKHDEKPDITKRMQHYIPAPKMKLPGHEESYNPPPEYLFTKEEEEKWNEQEPEERKINFIPKKYSSLRLVPAFDNFIRERFERCLDLYLCPRQTKMKANVNPDDLIPVLPKPKDLQPFPSVQALVYLGHEDMVNCITVEPAGQFLASGSDDHTVRIWEVRSGRCLQCIHFVGAVKAIAWCPNQSLSLVAAAVGRSLYIINPIVGNQQIQSYTDEVLKNTPAVKESSKQIISWEPADSKLQKQGIRIVITHPKEIRQVTWEARGIYFATVMPDAGSQSVVIHKLSTWKSQMPFKRNKGLVQCVQFHPLRPYFFVATKSHIRMYNLMKEELTKKMQSNCKWLSSLAIHPKGDNLIIGSYDSKLSWFDLDASSKPHKTLRYHKKAIRQVAYHRCYPLFASASDDASVIVSHGMVYNSLHEKALIVPVKVLKGHAVTNNIGVLDCCFHPHQPWIFSSGSDGTIRLYT